MANEFKVKNGIISEGNIVVSGSIVTTGTVTISGSIASASYATNAEFLDNMDSTMFTFTSSFNTVSASLDEGLKNVIARTGSFATTGSNVFYGNQTVSASVFVSGSVTATGQIVAQTINVQSVTSSVVYSSGSNVFGNDVSNTQTFTGSMLITGSMRTVGTICSTGNTCFGGNTTVAGCVGIGVSNPSFPLQIKRPSGGNGTVMLVGNDNVTGLPGITFCNDNGGGTASVGLTANCQINVNNSVYVCPSGNVGINTSAPKDTLVIGEDLGGFGSGYNAVTIGCSTKRTGLFIGQCPLNNVHLLWNCSSTIANAYASLVTYGYSNPLYIDASRVIIQGNNTTGRVGIGIDSPCTKFHVQDSNTANCFCSIAIFSNSTPSIRLHIKDEDGTLQNPTGIYSETGFGTGIYNCGLGACSGVKIFTGAPVSQRLWINCTGVACFSSTVCAPYFINPGVAICGTNANTWLTVNDLRDGNNAETTALHINTIHRSSGLNGVNHYGLRVTPNFSVQSSNLGTVYGALITPFETGIYNVDTAYGLFVRATCVCSGTLTNSFAAVFLCGNVGIGTPSPQGALHVGTSLSNSSDAAAINLKQTGTTAGTGIYLERSAERKGYYISIGGSADSLNFTRNNGGTVGTVLSLDRDGVASFTGNTCISGIVYAADGGCFRSRGDARVLYLRQVQGNSDNIIQFMDNNGTYIWEVVGRNQQFYIYNAAVGNFSMCINPSTNAVHFPGAVSKGSGTFNIEHPLESKKCTHRLVHSFIEGPNADLFYSGHTTLINGVSCINIDCAARMTEGTFLALNRCVRVFTTNETSWDAVRGKMVGNILVIESQNNESTDDISWMVIGERQDKHIRETSITDELGRIIVEPEIREDEKFTCICNQ